MDDCAAVEQMLTTARKVLVVLEQQAASYTSLTIPPHLKVQLEEKRQDVTRLEALLSQLQAGKSTALQDAVSTLPTFDFEVVTVDERGRKVSNRHLQAEFYREDLGEGIALEMVSIPGGKFTIGSPESEPERSSWEGPQREITIKPFFMGKYPITQAQWQAVMGSNLSRLKGANLPVENVSWNDAVAFCQQLSKRTGKTYRLPSEAEWEYACRARTTTPFYFGETITPELVNYDGDYPYGNAPKGKYREQMTPVGSFQVANNFGLYDMHGNVCEWCADPWHESYRGIPADGSVWEFGGNDSYRMLRGGSWDLCSWHCRSAYRGKDVPDYRFKDIGFRVVSVSPAQIR